MGWEVQPNFFVIYKHSIFKIILNYRFKHLTTTSLSIIFVTIANPLRYG